MPPKHVLPKLNTFFLPLGPDIPRADSSTLPTTPTLPSIQEDSPLAPRRVSSLVFSSQSPTGSIRSPSPIASPAAIRTPPPLRRTQPFRNSRKSPSPSPSPTPNRQFLSPPPRWPTALPRPDRQNASPTRSSALRQLEHRVSLEHLPGCSAALPADAARVSPGAGSEDGAGLACDAGEERRSAIGGALGRSSSRLRSCVAVAGGVESQRAVLRSLNAPFTTIGDSMVRFCAERGVDLRGLGEYDRVEIYLACIQERGMPLGL